jgi:hypothetical protein
MNIFRITWQVTLVEQEVFTLQEHMGSPTFLKGFVLLGLMFSV